LKYIALVPFRNKNGKIAPGDEVEISDKEVAKKLITEKKIKEKK